MSFDPGQVMSDVEHMSERLEKAADVFSETIEAYERIESEYELAMAKARTQVQHEAEKEDRRLAADLRNDHALQAIDPDLRVRYSQAKAAKESQSVRFRALTAACSARQSLLKALTNG